MATDPKPSQHSIDECLHRAARIGAGRERPSNLDNRRDHSRHAYHVDIPVLWLGELNKGGEVTLLRASDIGVGGIRLISRQMLYPCARGVIQLSRGGTDHALVGIHVIYTDYVGEMRYASGCRFTPVPKDVLASRFSSADGAAARLRPGHAQPRRQRGAA